MSDSNRKPNDYSDFDDLMSRVAALERVSASGFPILSSSLAPRGKAYVDASDGKLYFMDSSGVPNPLY